MFKGLVDGGVEELKARGQEPLGQEFLAGEDHLGQLAQHEAHHEGGGRHKGGAAQGPAQGLGEVPVAHRVRAGEIHGPGQVRVLQEEGEGYPPLFKNEQALPA